MVAEFYPSRRDPVLGIWAHRQALATRDAGAEVRVLVLHRLIPPRASLAGGPIAGARALAGLAREPRTQVRDGLNVTYVPYVSPFREHGYASWGAWAAPSLAFALRRLARSFPFELVHAHNAVPAGDAVRRARPDTPLVVSVHGGDVLYTARRSERGAAAVARTLGTAELVLANSEGTAGLAREAGAKRTRVVHLGADLPPRSRAHASRAPPTRPRSSRSPTSSRASATPTCCARLPCSERAIPRCATRSSATGPSGYRSKASPSASAWPTASTSAGSSSPPRPSNRRVDCTLFVMPSTEEAFGVAYIEAMAAGVPAIGCRGEPGPEEIAAAGDGFLLVPPGDIERLTQRIDELLSDPHRLREAGQRARASVAANFTWERCGEETLAAYRSVLR